MSKMLPQARTKVQASSLVPATAARTAIATHAATGARPAAAPPAHNFGRMPATVQAKLTLDTPGDGFEQEADRVATLVTGTTALPPPPIATQPAATIARKTDMDDGAQPDAATLIQQTLAGGGRPLDSTTRGVMQARFGHDFSQVRIHTGEQADRSAEAISARAYTHGPNIVFAGGQYLPQTAAGQHLIAHELTHVVQQGAAAGHPAAQRTAVAQRAPSLIQRSFFGNLWSGIQSVGRAVGGAIVSAANWVGGAAVTAANWVGDRVHDASQWAVNLIRDLPARLARLAQSLWDGLAGIITFIPEAIQALRSGGIRGFAGWLWEKAKRGGAWLLTLVSRVFDVLGGPELAEFITHIITLATPLTDAEKTAAKSVLGAGAIRYDDVRVAESGLLSIIFHFNHGRAFATFHTINLPSTGAHGRANVAIVVHELTHVYQYERVGSLYLGQAIHAQATIGYGYGGAAGLTADRAAGKHYRDYNREQQAQIAQDYYTLVQSGGSTTDYDPFIAELRAGAL